MKLGVNGIIMGTHDERYPGVHKTGKAHYCESIGILSVGLKKPHECACKELHIIRSYQIIL